MAVQRVRRCGLSAGLQSSRQPPISRSQHSIQSGRTRFEHGPGGREKDASDTSRWGMELAMQAGKDSANFGFSPTAPNVSGSDWVRHFALADVSYLVPVGKGLTLQAGLFNSLIGYDSLYAKDNFTYTRPWGGDYTPYLMFGVNGSYPFSKKITVSAFIINDYAHLAHPNSVPSVGGQLAYLPTGHLTFKETPLYGPHQSDTA